MIECRAIAYSSHGLRQMFSRGLEQSDVAGVIDQGEEIITCPQDRPYPSCVMLGYAGSKPLHVVVAYDESLGNCIVIAAYVPDPKLWDEDFMTRRNT